VERSGVAAPAPSGGEVSKGAGRVICRKGFTAFPQGNTLRLRLHPLKIVTRRVKLDRRLTVPSSEPILRPQ